MGWEKVVCVAAIWLAVGITSIKRDVDFLAIMALAATICVVVGHC